MKQEERLKACGASTMLSSTACIAWQWQDAVRYGRNCAEELCSMFPKQKRKALQFMHAGALGFQNRAATCLRVISTSRVSKFVLGSAPVPAHTNLLQKIVHDFLCLCCAGLSPAILAFRSQCAATPVCCQWHSAQHLGYLAASQG